MVGHIISEKGRKALAILESCIGTKGIWASPDRYKDQCWTRDLALAIQPLLLDLGRTTSFEHLANLADLQQQNGKIPILFLDDEARWLEEKEAKSKAQGRESFMLRRYREGQLHDLTPGTRDSEICFALAVMDFNIRANEELIVFHDRALKAIAYVESRLMVDGLHYGADWRDTMHKELLDKALLTNNSLLFLVYTLYGQKERAARLRKRVLESHLINGRFIDYPGSDRFDPLGGALAVLTGLAPEESYAGLLKSFRSVDSSTGVTIKCKHNPVSPAEREVIDRTDGVVTWPFVVGFTVLAALRMGEEAFAREQFAKMQDMVGFAEWYDPATGQGYGAPEQLWSATLYARAEFHLTGSSSTHQSQTL